MPTAYVALGANLGDRLTTLQRAIDRLGDIGSVEAISPVFETDPVGFAAQLSFLNAVARVETSLPAPALMGQLLAIEAELGRERSFPNAPRTMDLDLLFYDDLIVDTTLLVLPHPRLHERAFVLVPLATVAPNLVHPRLGKTVATLLAEMGSTAGVHPTDAELHRR